MSNVDDTEKDASSWKGIRRSIGTDSSSVADQDDCLK